MAVKMRSTGKFACERVQNGKRCGKAFTSPSSLKDHINAEHEGHRWSCCFCGKECKDRSDNRRHQKVCKSNSAPKKNAYHCGWPGCDAVFGRIDNAKRHMKTCKKSCGIELPAPKKLNQLELVESSTTQAAAAHPYQPQELVTGYWGGSQRREGAEQHAALETGYAQPAALGGQYAATGREHEQPPLLGMEDGQQTALGEYELPARGGYGQYAALETGYAQPAALGGQDTDLGWPEEYPILGMGQPSGMEGSGQVAGMRATEAFFCLEEWVLSGGDLGSNPPLRFVSPRWLEKDGSDGLQPAVQFSTFG